MKHLILPILAVTPLFAGAEFFPLQEGNRWTYRQRGGQSEYTNEVGAASTISDNRYFKLTGYTTVPLWVRSTDAGLFYAKDDGSEALLTSFVDDGAWFAAPFRVCDEEGMATATPGTLTVKYRTLRCADAGVEQETFAANLGMTQRVEQSFVGPRTFDLVTARVGTYTLAAEAGSGAGFRISVRNAPDGASATAVLELRADSPVTIHYASGQDFDAVLRSPDGNIVWRWSDGKAFTQVLRDEVTSGKRWMVEFPLPAKDAEKYQLEAWLVTIGERPQFSATAPIPGQQ